ncbi:MAG: aminotransferase class V-fold PLP-dependent enzyme [Hyphomicrobiales bacterium]|nr:aminotransferase class V-fold PLP-dependent enzyme [Hyphomicrobiales bacterium]
MQRTYLDHNASSPLRPEARDAMLAAMETCGNPSSIHAEGRAARAIVEAARETVARSMGVAPRNVIFTSGGTEAANTAIFAASRALRPGAEPAAIVASATEHACVLQAPSHVIPVSGKGLLDLNELRARLSAIGPTVMAVQDANNETGVKQPHLELAKIAREADALTVCDAVQTAGRTGVDAGALGADIVFISGHKFGGPKGVGAVVLGRDLTAEPLLRGGGQERGRRGGTENVAGIAGMAAALTAGDAASKAFGVWALKAQGELEAGLRAICSDVVIFGEGAARIQNTTCFAMPGVPAEIALMAFDLEGISVSSGSACSSGKVAPSHVLAAMGVAPNLAKCAIRVSTGWNTTDANIERFLDVWDKIYTRLRPRAAA